MTGETQRLERAQRLFEMFGGFASEQPFSSFGLLNAFDFGARAVEAVIVGPIEASGSLVEAAFSIDAPNLVLVRASSPEEMRSESPAFGRPMVNGAPTAYVCREGVCSLPITDPETLRDVLLEGRSP